MRLDLKEAICGVLFFLIGVIGSAKLFHYYLSNDVALATPITVYGSIAVAVVLSIVSVAIFKYLRQSGACCQQRGQTIIECCPPPPPPPSPHNFLPLSPH
jgi:hypothetical protein